MLLLLSLKMLNLYLCSQPNCRVTCQYIVSHVSLCQRVSDSSIFREQMISKALLVFISTDYIQVGSGVFNLFLKNKGKKERRKKGRGREKKERKYNLLKCELTSGFGLLTFLPYLYIPFQHFTAAIP